MSEMCGQSECQVFCLFETWICVVVLHFDILKFSNFDSSTKYISKKQNSATWTHRRIVI